MSCCGNSQWRPPDPYSLSCCVLQSYSPAPGAYCCDLNAQRISEELFPPPVLPDLNRLEHECCLKKVYQRQPVSYEYYMAKRRLGL